MAFIYFALALLIVVIDQAIKYFVVIYLEPVSSVTAIPHVLDLVYLENTGVAFGMFKDLRWLFVVLTAVIIVVFTIMLFKNAKTSKLFSIASLLIVGGGIGNLIDRVFRGFVVDYLQLSFFPPVCNFADYCITVGTIILIIYLMFYSDSSINSKVKSKKSK